MAEQLSTGFEARPIENVIPRFVGLTSASAKRIPTGQHPAQGIYWTLKDIPAPSVAVMLVHYNADFSEHYLSGPLAARGYGVLGFNTRYRGAEDMFILENALDDIAAGAKWLRNEAKAKKIVLIGNSGGGSLLAAYQAKAQQEPSYDAADAFIFLNSHIGRPDAITKWLDPSVIDENDPVKTNPTLDMYDPKNKPPYSKKFIAQYRDAQIERNDRITDWAIKELERLNAAGIPDRNFPLYRTMADPRFNDPTIEPTDRPCPACYAGLPSEANRGVSLLGRSNTLKTWLSMWSLKHSQCRLEPYAAQIRSPVLVVQGTADVGVFPSDAQQIFDSVGSMDKELHFVKGPHFFDDSQEELDFVVDLIASWLDKKL